MGPRGNTRVGDLPRWQREFFNSLTDYELLGQGFAILRDCNQKNIDFILNQPDSSPKPLEFARTGVEVFTKLFELTHEAIEMYKHEDITVAERMLLGFRLCKHEIEVLRRLMAAKEQVCREIEAISSQHDECQASDLPKWEREVFVYTNNIDLLEQGYTRIKNCKLKSIEKINNFRLALPDTLEMVQTELNAYSNLIALITQAREMLAQENLTVAERLRLVCNLIKRKTQAFRELMEFKEKDFKKVEEISAQYEDDVSLV